jgi:hypothetical protein
MCTAEADQHHEQFRALALPRRKTCILPIIYGYGVAVVCAVIVVAHAPGLTHHLHWKATVIWTVAAIVVAVGSAFLPVQTRSPR